MRKGFTKPTEIQAQARPIDLQSNGLDDIAETGCGKSITYVLPMLISIQAPSGKLSLTRKPSAMKTLLGAKWFFTETHGYQLWGVSASSNGLHMASKGR